MREQSMRERLEAADRRRQPLLERLEAELEKSRQATLERLRRGRPLLAHEDEDAPRRRHMLGVVKSLSDEDAQLVAIDPELLAVGLPDLPEHLERLFRDGRPEDQSEVT